MSLDYVFGPVVCTDTLLNINLQFHRVRDRQEKVSGWAWSQDWDDHLYGECEGGLYDVDPDVAIDDVCRALRERLYELVTEWEEAQQERRAATQAAKESK